MPRRAHGAAGRRIRAIALITPSARSCFDETRGGCYTAGLVDNLSSADDCQAACAFDSACNYFAYHSANGVDDDGNGYVDDCYGWDHRDDDADPADDDGHGTHCSGTVAADTNNNI